jgi:HSP20 family protein
MASFALARARERALGLPSTGLIPFELMQSLSDDMDRLFTDFGARWPFASLVGDRDRSWSPDIEVEAREGKLFVRADLPGLSKADIKIDVTDHSMTIQGQRQRAREVDEDGYYRSERSYGAFSRTVALPEGAKVDTTKATFIDGVLEIVVDLPSQSRPAARRIEIETKPGA